MIGYAQDWPWLCETQLGGSWFPCLSSSSISIYSGRRKGCRRWCTPKRLLTGFSSARAASLPMSDQRPELCELHPASPKYKLTRQSGLSNDCTTYVREYRYPSIPSTIRVGSRLDQSPQKDTSGSRSSYHWHSLRKAGSGIQGGSIVRRGSGRSFGGSSRHG